ncbi:MAG: D-alanyl-D-alanine carboxypeptidase [Lachnospiraceae bacterium]|nr:D-alanyl-D-alanine carboxypeptidase [Lachnospiraceae bacterium]
MFIFAALFFTPLDVHATSAELNAEADARRAEEPESNSIEGWPDGPHVGAEGAVLMEAGTGAILYSKNPDEKLYPASITKLMCCLVAIENCSLDTSISVNQSAIDANDPDGSSMGLKAGETLTLEELLYGILINSANESCNVVAEHIAGSIDAYVEMMNERAVSLGCTGTHFVTPNGLFREEHYTTAHDMALIGRAFFSHDILAKMASTPSLTIPASDVHEEHVLHSKNKLYKGGEYEYSSLVGSKTGFTSPSRQTLVSCAEKNGIRLVAVVLKEESPSQFSDTVALFDYGFSSFSLIDPSEYETKYHISNSSFFNSGNGIFGSTAPLLSTSPSSVIVMPADISFSDLDSGISYENLNDGSLAKIEYNYKGVYLGCTDIIPGPYLVTDIDFERALSNGSPLSANETAKDHIKKYGSVSSNEEEKKEVYVNVYHVIGWIAGCAAAVIVLSIFWAYFKKYLRHRRKINKIKKAREGSIKNRAALRRGYRKHHSGKAYLTKKNENDTAKRKRPVSHTDKRDNGEVKNNRDNFKFPY